MILLYVTHPDKEHASRIAGTLIKEKLIACANIFPIDSMYEWEGGLVEETEYVTILKTFEGYREMTINRINALHSYDIPCIIDMRVDVNNAYENWLIDCLKINTS